MIRYALLCPQDHGFEAWFRDSETFDQQNGAGHVACPVCGSPEVRKAVMAPAVRRSKTPSAFPAPASPAPASPSLPATEAPVSNAAPSETPTPQPASAPIADEAFGKVRAALRELHTRLKQNAENVGSAFPAEARRIHEGDEPPRAIYGTATDDEVRSLVEDGVGIMPIPTLPDDRN